MAARQSIQRDVERTEMLIHSARDLREKFESDPHRPRYHFLPPAGWMNDINGPLFWKGRYHIFYQFNPDEACWKQIQWGHASSVDLVHWVQHPVALAPDPEGPDRAGCFSGGMVVHQDVPTIVYHGQPDGTCLATSHDDLLLHWTKHPANPVIRSPKPGDPDHGRYRVYDPCAWKRGDFWYVLCGGLDPEKGDTAFHFRSRDLVRWEYLHPFYDSRRDWTHVDEDCAVPDFFPLGDRHVLSFSSHLLGSQYYVGRYDGDRFYPERHGRLSWPGALNVGAITMLDGLGRRLYFTWILEGRKAESQRAAGWAGVMSLPQILSLDSHGCLEMQPAPELKILRLGHTACPDRLIAADSEVSLGDLQGDCLELQIEISPGDARECGVKVRCSPDGAEQTAIVYDATAQTLWMDASKSSIDPDVSYPRYLSAGRLKRMPEPEAAVSFAKKAHLALRPGEPLMLHIFLDRSVVEVFANGRQCVLGRIYPARADSQGLALFSRGSAARISAIGAYPLASA